MQCRSSPPHWQSTGGDFLEDAPLRGLGCPLAEEVRATHEALLQALAADVVAHLEVGDVDHACMQMREIDGGTTPDARPESLYHAHLDIVAKGVRVPVPPPLASPSGTATPRS